MIDFLVLLIPAVILTVIFAGKAYSRLFAYAKAHRGETNIGKDPRFVHLTHLLQTPVLHATIGVALITAIYLIGMYLATGATLGKLALGLRITRIDGRPMTVRDAVMRSLVFWVGNPFIPVIGIWIWLLEFVGGTLVLLIRSDHRGPEDLLGGTMVVRKESQGMSLAELTGVGPRPPAAPPLGPPDAPVRGGHLPGWGPVSEQQPPPPGDTPS